ncbi:hypothetical protein EDI_206360 [Entamoeba dispar SAW760]|uniref:Nbr1 FW domain-containing protein n=1 Tax=Entamoeba dispar (strain ATCC PRA-260 / SAW760) TaxID=370354 RepID=B0EIL7_ENTDS|nr:uncharacterized protein EDI_206360 [Entamoeba dispar SAW760]EDR25640.1 hypothetical protein EDI_206360 [Entamoeba dispar SAW760]|eukprot:EDR25640.1 hypothetical protein EDI_206360 [Entamoeba dispar SAW760]
MQKQFLVEVDCCGVEHHRIIVDQRMIHLKSFNKKLRSIFRQLPKERVLLYCSSKGPTTITNQNDWIRFYQEVSGVVNLHIFENENGMISTKEGLMNIIEILVLPQLSQSFMCWKELNTILQDEEFKNQCKLIIQMFTKKCQIKEENDCKKKEVGYQMEFIRDVTFKSIQIIHKNEKHIKIWMVQNSGNQQWPKGCYIGQWKGNELIPTKSNFIIPQIIRSNIIQVSYEFMIEQCGTWNIQCRLFTIDHIPFGDILWIRCTVIE